MPIWLRGLALVSLAAWVTVAGPSGSRAEELSGIEAVYGKPSDLTTDESPRICLLDTEHPDVVRSDVAKKGIDKYKCRLFAKDLQRLAGVPVILLHYTQVGRKDLVGNTKVRAVVLSARAKTISPKYDDELFALIREIRVPTLGICGGHQLIVQAYGGEFKPMRKLRPGEADPHPEYYPGLFKEWGFMDVKIVREDPLFKGFRGTLNIREFHAYEVTRLPEAFDILASTDECRVEAIKHKEKPLYGTQFHPERYDAEHRDGEALLKNFLHIAGL